MTKRYKLLKDLPGYNAGEIFANEELTIKKYYAVKDGSKCASTFSMELGKLPEWFEEVKDPKEEPESQEGKVVALDLKTYSVLTEHKEHFEITGYCESEECQRPYKLELSKETDMVAKMQKLCGKEH